MPWSFLMGVTTFYAKAFLLLFCLFGILISCSKISREEYESGNLPSKYQAITEESKLCEESNTCDLCKERVDVGIYYVCPCGKPTHYKCYIDWFKRNEDKNEYSCPVCKSEESFFEFLELKTMNFYEKAQTIKVFGLKAFVALNMSVSSITISDDKTFVAFEAEENGVPIVFKCDYEQMIAEKKRNAIEVAFMYAACFENLGLIKFIVSNYNENDIFDFAINKAIKANKLNSVKLLLDSRNFEPEKYKNFLLEAIRGDKSKILMLLLKQIDDVSGPLYKHEGKSLLSVAVELNSQNCICALIINTIVPDDVTGPIEIEKTKMDVLIPFIVKTGNVQAVKNVLKLGIPITRLRLGNKYTIFEVAASSDKPEMFKFLLASGLISDEDKIREIVKCYYNALSFDRVENLNLIKDFDINLVTTTGYTVLQYAIFFSNLKMVEKALDHGADVNFATETFGYPLHHAIFKDNKDMVALLLRNGASLDLVGDHGFDGKGLALIKGNIEAFKAIADHLKTDSFYNKEGLNTLQLAIKYGHIEMVKYLIGQGVTALNAFGKNNFMISEISLMDSSELLDYLLGTCGADVYEHDPRYGVAFDSPAQIAIVYGQYKNLEVLLKHGYNPNLRIDSENSTLLHQAISLEKFDMANLLIKYGADTNALDNLGRTAFSYVQSEETVKMLRNMDEYL